MDVKTVQKAVDFHGHICPGLAIGIRAVEAVQMNDKFCAIPYGKMVCVTENDACGVDAIQCLLGCSAGKGNLIFRPRGKQAFSFFDRESGYALRLCLKAGKGGLSRDAWLDTLLHMPLEDVFLQSVPAFAVPVQPRLFESIVCEICGEGVAEPHIRREGGKNVCLDCQQESPRRW